MVLLLMIMQYYYFPLSTDDAKPPRSGSPLTSIIIQTSRSSEAVNTTLPSNASNSLQASTISSDNHHQSISSGSVANSGAGGSSAGVASNGAGNQETCLICGDVASGKHYGLRSCEACKAFFKRTVQGKIEYSCPATRECEINKRRRKACQACRFQKCLNMGMLKEGVRLDRVRGGRQKYRRGISPTPGSINVSASCLSGSSLNNNSSSASAMSSKNSNNTNLNTNGNQSNSSSLLSSSASLAAMAGSSSHLAFPLANVTTIAATHQTAIGTGETNKILTALINCEPEELSAAPGQYVTNIPSNLSVQLKTLYILGDLFDRELVSLIGWAKQIPGFSESITLNDQMRLLQSTWAEVIALSIGYRSHLKRIENCKLQQLGGSGNAGGSGSGLSIHSFMSPTTPSPTSSSPASTTSSSYNNNTNSLYNLENTEIRLVFAKDLIIDFKHALLCGAEEIFYICVQLIKRLDHLRITPKEYILLKAISLTNADIRLENPKATLRLRDLVMDALYEVTLTESLNANGGLISQNDISSVANLKQEICGNNNGAGPSASVQQLKLEAQERPPSSTNQYASSSSSPTPPSRSSSSVPSSSSTSSISPHNNSSNIINVASLDLAGKKTIINNRMNQVLLCLPVLRQIDSSIRKFWNDIRKGPNNVPMNKLFEEMLEPCQRMYRSSVEM